MNYKVKRTMKVDGEIVEELFPVIYRKADSCRIKMESVLEEAYGDEWRELHGDDFQNDDDGMPHYFFDMDEGEFEEMAVVDVDDDGNIINDRTYDRE